MTKDQNSSTGSQSNRIVNSRDGWAHVHDMPSGRKTFYAVYLHHKVGDTELYIMNENFGEAEHNAYLWNQRKLYKITDWG